MAGTAHHVFPYNPAHLGLTPEQWIEAQVGKWPLAAVAKMASPAPSRVHFIGRRNNVRHLGNLQFVEHRSLGSGPAWRDWGDDWSGSLARTAEAFGHGDVCFLHMDSCYAAMRVHHLGQRASVVVVLHGRGYGGDHIRRADAVVGLRDEVRDVLVGDGYPADRILITRPSIDRSLFRRTVPPAAPPPLRLGFVGTLTAYKGTEQLLETASALLTAGTRFSLDVLGTGHSDEVRKFAQQAAARGVKHLINIRGHLPPGDVAKAMAGWHILLHPSHTEGMPITILESLSTGLPMAAVRGVFAPELERQPGVHVYKRNEYADAVCRDFTTIAGSRCSDELVLDHSLGSELWARLGLITRRGSPVACPSALSRCWRLRPLRDLARGHPAVRPLLRSVRRALGPLGGLK